MVEFSAKLSFDESVLGPTERQYASQSLADSPKRKMHWVVFRRSLPWVLLSPKLCIPEKRSFDQPFVARTSPEVNVKVYGKSKSIVVLYHVIAFMVAF
jgi:hypothetical protein